MPADPLKLAAGAAVAGAVAGAAIAVSNKARKAAAKAGHETTTLADLEKAP
jgi:hypothetical protein